MKRFKWYHFPLLLTSSALAFNTFVFIIMGVDLLPGHDGARWVCLVVATLVSLFLCGIMAD